MKLYLNLALLFLLVGCSTYTKDVKSIRSDFRSGSYSKALSALEKSKYRDQKRNRLLFLLEKGSILDRMGQKEKSRRIFIEAGRVSDQLYRRSLSGDVASFVYNDSAMDYQGEDYEKVAIHTMLALSFLETQDLSKARVEARKINTELTEINSFYKKNKNRYADDAFARFLAGLTYEARGELDAAIVEYRASLKTYMGAYRKYFDTPTPRDLVVSLYRVAKERRRTAIVSQLLKSHPFLKKWKMPKDRTSILVVHEMDNITFKTSEDFVFSWDGKSIRFSFPVIRKKYISSYGVSGLTVNGSFHRGRLAQNMDAIASETLADSKGRYIAKMAARVVMKDQIAQQAKKSLGPLGELAAGIYGAVTETADTRSWTLLPAAFAVTRVYLKPGKHSLKVKTNGRVSDFQSITLKPGEMRFLRDY